MASSPYGSGNPYGSGGFPEVFCIESLHCTPVRSGGYEYRVVLYHDRASLTVSFRNPELNRQLKRGSLVSVLWLPEASSDRGAVRVDSLQLRDCAANGFNPFESVPHSWGADRHRVECARDLWEGSSKPLRQLLFETFWVGLPGREPEGRRV